MTLQQRRPRLPHLPRRRLRRAVATPSWSCARPRATLRRDPALARRRRARAGARLRRHARPTRGAARPTSSRASRASTRSSSRAELAAAASRRSSPPDGRVRRARPGDAARWARWEVAVRDRPQRSPTWRPGVRPQFVRGAGSAAQRLSEPVDQRGALARHPRARDDEVEAGRPAAGRATSASTCE